MPDSLLTAAKKTAEAAGLSWSDVLPTFRVLQEAKGADPTPWLPKSVGRNVWYAHPNFITRLLCALVAADSVSEAHDVVAWANNTTPNGRTFLLTERPAAGVLAPLEVEFHQYLADVEAAQDLTRVEFRPDTGEIVLESKKRGAVVYSREGEGGPRPARGISSRGVIDGSVFVRLAQTVDWRKNSDPPYRGAAVDEASDD